MGRPGWTTSLQVSSSSRNRLVSRSSVVRLAGSRQQPSSHSALRAAADLLADEIDPAHPVQLRRCGDAEHAHEVGNVELIGTAVRALFWLASHTSASGIAASSESTRARVVGAIGQGKGKSVSTLDRSRISLRDKPDYPVLRGGEKAPATYRRRLKLNPQPLPPHP